MPAVSKRVCFALGAVIAVAASAFLVVRFATTPADNPEPKGDDEKKPQARQYLKLPGAVSQPPAWLVADAPFDVKELFQSVPEDENAAPLYLEALLEFCAEQVSLFPEDQHKGLYQRYRPRMDRLNRLSQAWDNDRKSVSAAELDALLKEFEPGFEKLAEAQKRSRGVFESGIGVSTLFPHVQACRSVARVVQLQMTRDVDRGDLNRSLRQLDILLRLTRDLRPRAFIISQLVAIACDSIAYKAITGILDSRHCSKEDCDRLLALLGRHEKQMPDAAGIAIKMEYLMIRNALRDIEYRTGDFSPEGVARITQNFGLTGGSIGSLLATMSGDAEARDQRAKQIDTQLQLMTAADYSREAETLRSDFRELLKTARQPFPQAQMSRKRLQTVANKSLFVSVFVGGNQWDMVLSAVARETALLRGTQCLVALRRWQLEGKEAPADLASVVKAAGMSGVPTDPFSGELFKMTKRSDQPVVYSIGPDLVDDGGRLEVTGRSNGDLLFRLAVPFK